MTDEFRDSRERPDTAPGETAPDDPAADHPAAGDPAAGEAAQADDEPRDQRRAERRRRARERTFDTIVASPCIAICQLGTDDLCIGCLRSMDEIRDWPIMTAEEKRTVLAKIETRKAE